MTERAHRPAPAGRRGAGAPAGGAGAPADGGAGAPVDGGAGAPAVAWFGRHRAPAGASGSLSALDDLLVHQTLDNLGAVIAEDERWTERFIIEAHAPDDSLLLFTGLGIYPNTNYVDGFALVGSGQEQRNLRAGRELHRDGRDPFDLRAGPLRFEILVPGRRWRLAADDVGQGFAFDLVFQMRTQPYQMPTMRIVRDGALLVGYSHFVQAGRFDGWIEVDGDRRRVDGWTGERDRSWGVRPSSARVRRGLHFWIPLQFDDVSLWLWTHEDAQGRSEGVCGAVRPVGDDPGPPVPVVGIRHELDIDKVGPHRVLRAGELDVVTADDRRLRIEVRRDGPVLGLVGGGYGGEHAQGTPKGPDFVAFDRWSTAPESFRRVPHTILEHACECRLDGRVGRGDVELCIGEYAPLGLGPVE